MNQAIKKRLDLLLVERGLAESRTKAQALILAQQVQVYKQKTVSPYKEEKVTVTPFVLYSQPLKPGILLFENVKIALKSPTRFVSRGGEKLQSAIVQWRLSLNNKICMDLGSSTGGFTDCLLQNGAQRVYAVDVGYGQFHPKLRNDPRVVLYEKTHILKWQPPWLAQEENRPSFVTIDLSFISLTKVLPKLLEDCCNLYPTQPPLTKGRRMNAPIEILALIKPQFEVGEKKFLKKGIVKDENVRQETVKKIVNFFSSCGLKILGQFPCPILGAEGNQEEWLYARDKG